jgi:hypothetical protein
VLLCLSLRNNKYDHWLCVVYTEKTVGGDAANCHDAVTNVCLYVETMRTTVLFVWGVSVQSAETFLFLAEVCKHCYAFPICLRISN